MMIIPSLLLLSFLLFSAAPVAVSATGTRLDCNLEKYYHALDLGRGLWLSHISDRQTITMELTFEGHAWLSVGPSKTGRMVVSDAVIGIPQEDENNNNELYPINPAKYRMTTESATGSGVNVLPDSYQTLRDASITQNVTHTVLRFTKKLVENDELPIAYDKTSTWIYAVGYSNAYPTMHARHGAVRFPLLNTCIQVQGDDADWEEKEQVAIATAAAAVKRPAQANVLMDVSDRNLQATWRAHGIVMALAWGVLAPSSVGLVFLRNVPWAKRRLPGIETWWLPVHQALNMLTGLLTLTGFILAVVATNINTTVGTSAVHFQGPHGRIGLVVFVLVFVQIVVALFCRPRKLVAKTKIKLVDGLYKEGPFECDTTAADSSQSDRGDDDDTLGYTDPIMIQEATVDPPQKPSNKQLKRMSPDELIMEACDFLGYAKPSEQKQSNANNNDEEEGGTTTVRIDDYKPTAPGTVHVAARSQRRFVWEVSHRAIGVAVMILALYICPLGIQEHVEKYGEQDDWTRLFWLVSGTVGGLFFFSAYLLR